MIEVKFYYKKLNGKWYQAWKSFNSAFMAVRFIRKCNASPKMIYSGEFSADDPIDAEYIWRANI